MLFEAKLRVMPTCWFLLSKFYLRVDGVLTRCRETRLFHKFAANNNNTEETSEAVPIVVHMEVLWREAETPVAVPAGVVETRPGGVFNLPTAVGIASGATAVGTLPGLMHRSAGGGTVPGNLHPALRGAVSNNVNTPSTSVTGIRPQHVLSNAESRNTTHLLPVVNEKERIHQYFVLTL